MCHERVSHCICAVLHLGVYQRGQAGVDACNVFFYLTYEGSVNLPSLDEKLRAGLLAQIAHYGQTPRQLFNKPHLNRDALPEPKHRVERLLSMMFETEAKDLSDPISFVCAVNEHILAVGRYERELVFSKLVNTGAIELTEALEGIFTTR